MNSPRGLDLDFDEDAVALASAVRSLCERMPDDNSGPLPRPLWRGLADMGIFGLAAKDEGSVEAMSAVMFELGRAAVRGPLVATAVAVRALDPDEAKGLIGGDEIASIGAPPVMPWAPHATCFIEVSDCRGWRSTPKGDVEEVDTLAHEPWGRCTLERGAELSHFEEALAVGDVALASYLCGAGERLLAAATLYASQRTQFGRPISEFQAVSFPLADVRIRLTASGVLARLAAHAASGSAGSAHTDATVARVSATESALAAAYCSHQTFGAMGFTVEGPVGRVSSLIRQVSMFGRPPAELREAILAPYAV